MLCQVSDRAHLVFDFHQAVDGLQVVKYYCIIDDDNWFTFGISYVLLFFLNPWPYLGEH